MWVIGALAKILCRPELLNSSLLLPKKGQLLLTDTWCKNTCPRTSSSKVKMTVKFFFYKNCLYLATLILQHISQNNTIGFCPQYISTTIYFQYLFFASQIFSTHLVQLYFCLLLLCNEKQMYCNI